LTKDLTEHKVLVIVGPTAVGKTDLSLALAKKYAGKIVSADSRQIYRYMDIGTAKPAPNQLSQVKHFFISTHNPDQYYSAGEYGRESRTCISTLLKQKIRPIIVGGSGFYLRALLDGLYAPKDADLEIKEKWRQIIQQKGADFVYDYLKQIDPDTAQRLHPNDEQRIVRAIEVYEITGSPLSIFKSGREIPADFVPIIIGLRRPRQNLYERIERRVDLMIEQGLLDEVQSLLKNGYTSDLNALKTVGYKEVYSYIAKKISYSEMVDQIKMNSRRYAKRQITWFRKDDRINWIDVENKNLHQQFVEIEKALEQVGY
jgi:tRNA dimethylallyltransferase